MTHYICTGGCEGISDKPGTCQDESCPRHGMPLDQCGCTDDRHDGAFENGADGKEPTADTDENK